MDGLFIGPSVYGKQFDVGILSVLGSHTHMYEEYLICSHYGKA